MPSQRELVDSIQKTLKTLGRAVHPRELVARLEIPVDDQEAFFSLLEDLVESEFLKPMPGGRLKLGARRAPPPRAPEVEAWDGILSMNPRGFGFVTAVGHDDVFIPPDRVYEALHGDTVTVRIQGRSPRGAEGSVEAVVKRRNPRVAGVFRRRGRSAWLEPDDTRLRGPLTVTEGADAARDGDAAVVEITRFPLFFDELPEARLVQALGPEGEPETEVQKILLREQVNEKHSPAALENAEEMARKLRRVRLDGRRDLRQVPLPTIDPEDARDHDDAVWVERAGRGYRAYVAIADVSEYVQVGSPLDEEARARGCTIYLPDRAIPMLPSALAADLCSLLPEVDRYCLCVIADLDASGAVKGFELVEGVMRSAARLTYGGVARTLGFDEESPFSAQAEAMKGDLEVLAELAFKLRKRRMDRGALDLDLPEARVHLDTETGAPTAVTKRATRPGLKKAYSMIEEMMLLANELVASWLTDKNAPAIYRVHGKPDPQKLEKLALVGEKLGVPVDLERLEESLGVSEFLRETRDHERHHVLQLLLLRSLKQAQYDIDNAGHFGLASDCYLHFTSPIRRYPDLAVHRQVKQILRGAPIDRSPPAVETLRQSATEASVRERAAMEIEREVVDLYRALYMRQHIGSIFEGRVTALTGSGSYVALDDPFCDVLVRYEALGPDQYEVSEDELSVVGQRSGDRVTLGDTIELEIEDVALLRRTVYGRRVLDPESAERIRGSDAGGYGEGRRRGSSVPRATGPRVSGPRAGGGRAAEGTARRGRPSGGAAETRDARPSAKAGERSTGAGRERSAAAGGSARRGAAGSSRKTTRTTDEKRTSKEKTTSVSTQKKQPLVTTGLGRGKAKSSTAKSSRAKSSQAGKKTKRR